MGEDNDGIFADHAEGEGVAAPVSLSGGEGIEEEEAKVQLFEVSMLRVEPRRRVHTTDTCTSL